MIIEDASYSSLAYIFCSDEYITEINTNFLKHDYTTDIITFNMGDKNAIEGEIYISVETVRENASLFNTGFSEELHRVIFHGALHLCGYKDKSKKDAVLMRQMEDKYLDLYFKNK